MEQKSENQLPIYGDSSYQNVIAKGIVPFGEYMLTSYHDHHVYLKHISVSGKTRGWKFHISINIENVEVMERVWDLLLPILIKHQIKFAKFIKCTSADLNSEQDLALAGRQVTIYTKFNRDLNWKRFFEEIIIVLKSNGIQSGAPNICKMVDGSLNYVCYRNDLRKAEPVPSIEDTFQPPLIQEEAVPPSAVEFEEVPSSITLNSGLVIPTLKLGTALNSNNESDNYLPVNKLSKNNNMQYNPSNSPDDFKDLKLELAIELQFEPGIAIDDLQPVAEDNSTTCCCIKLQP